MAINMTNRALYCETLKKFLQEDKETVLGTLHSNNNNNLRPTSEDAWENEIIILQERLRGCNWEDAHVIFEYEIPRLGKRIDVVLLLNGIIFCLEFKVGQSDVLQADVDQVVDYALDLKYFHQASCKRVIVPILIPTASTESSSLEDFHMSNDRIFNHLITGESTILNIIIEVLKYLKSVCTTECKFNDINSWVNSPYSPTPTIIEAACSLLQNHEVGDIKCHEAEDAAFDETTKCVIDIINQTKNEGGKSICFVTGVPGAGKTLVGLNVALHQSFNSNSAAENERDLAVYLSGNGPLVKVLTAALAKDKLRRKDTNDKSNKLSTAKREVSPIIQNIHRYRDLMLTKIKNPIVDNAVAIDETKAQLVNEKSSYSEVEHIVIFDEAQRCWTKEKLAKYLNDGGTYGNKLKVKNFPMSEAEFLIWSLNLRKDWAVIVCLVGGGQEIKTGEAGIGVWVNAVKEKFKNWKVYISNQLNDKEYAEGNLSASEKNNCNVNIRDKLHLAVSMRSFRAENLSKFVHQMLERKVESGRKTYEEFKKNYPVVLTRDLNKAKAWLKQKARGSERYGIVASSLARRLKPLAIDVSVKCDIENWFLADKTDVRSSLFLEDAATEFDIQGLELDWTCLVWDCDFRYTNNDWKHYSFKGSKWQNIKKPEEQAYQLNAYRVLLTRARQGMVICVPEGDVNDPTRLPGFYDGTYEYLKNLGLEEI